MCLRARVALERSLCELRRLQRENNNIVRNLKKLSPPQHHFLYNRYSRNSLIIEKNDLLNYNKLKAILKDIPL